MKKTLSIVVALAMVFVMSFSAFAAEKPTDVPSDATALGTYYAELIANGATTEEVAAEMIADAQAGVIDSDNYIEMFATMINLGVDQNVVMNIMASVLDEFEAAGIEMPDINEILPSETTTEEESSEEETLPEEEESTDDSDFLNTILGILGSIGDMIFGSDDDTTGGEGEGDDTTGDDTTDDTWGDEDTGLDEGTDEDELVSDTGDTTVISVAAVALVAGAALVLTRKKSEDAE